MTIDSRGFVYALDALLLRTRWRLEILLVEASKAQSLVSMLATKSRLAGDEERAMMRIATPERASRIDPAVSANRLAFLLTLRVRLRRLQIELAAAERERNAAAAAVTKSRLQIELLERDRAESLKHHGLEIERKHQVAADGDWLARVSWARQHATSSALPVTGRTAI